MAPLIPYPPFLLNIGSGVVAFSPNRHDITITYPDMNKGVSRGFLPEQPAVHHRVIV